jgi:hypothetical protein
MKAKRSSNLSGKSTAANHSSLQHNTGNCIFHQQYCGNPNHKCTVMESNEQAEISKYYAAHTSNFKPATILLHILIWLTHVLILQVAIFPWCFSKFYEPGHCMIYLFFPCIWLTILPYSHANCLETWEPQLPGTLRACRGTALPYFLFATGRDSSLYYHFQPMGGALKAS